MRFRFGTDLVDHLRRMQAYLGRYGNHDWDRAAELPLHELFARFQSLRELIRDEGDAAEGLSPAAGG